MRNMWDVIHRLVDGEPLTGDEKTMAHSLVETHLAQHEGIAATLGVAHEKAAQAHERLFGTPGTQPGAPASP